MTVPAFLDSVADPVSFQELVALSDVDNGSTGGITTVRSMVVGGTLNWTEPSTALFKTPVDASGRFFDVLITRISSSTLELRLRNQAAVTLFTRRIQLGSGNLRIYASQQHLVLEFVQTSQNGNHIFCAYLLDMLPDLISDHVLYVVGNAYLSGSSTQDNQSLNVGHLWAIDNGATAVANRLKEYLAYSGGSYPFYTPAGRKFFRDAYIEINFAATFKWAGRLPHTLLCDNGFNGGDERKIYIDNSTYKTFKCLGYSSIAQVRAMVRKDT